MSNDFNSSFTDVNNTNLIGERYLLKKSLGEGSFGEVFLAEDIKFHPPRAVAIKLLLRKFLGDATVRADIEREASALARFNHPNILRVIDFDISPHQAYIVMDLAEGGSLADKIRPNPGQPTVRMPLPEVAHYLEQICDGLDEAHEAGLIHRDLKPLNILLDKRGRPLIADFGLATAVSNTQSSIVATETISGTPAYIAPEQWGGQISRASDTYAIGIIAYQLITGQLPFQGDFITMAYQHTAAPIPKLKDRAPDLIYPPALDKVLANVLAKDPKQRTRPAMEFYRQFQAALDGTAVVPAVSVIGTPSAWPMPATQLASVAPSSGMVQVRLQTAEILVAKPYIKPPVDPLVASRQAQARQENQRFINAIGAFIVLILIGAIVVATLIGLSLGPNGVSAVPVGFPPGVSLNTLSEPAGQVYSLAFSPDEKWLASGWDDKTVKLWDGRAGGTPTTLVAHTDLVGAVTFSADGKILASGSADKTVRLWDAASGKLLNTLIGHTDRVSSLAFSPDGKTLASGSGDKTVKLWDVTSGKLLNTLTGYASAVDLVAFSADGKILNAIASDNTVKRWEVASGNLLTTLSGQAFDKYSKAFSPDGKILATGSAIGKVTLWDTTTGKSVATLLSTSNRFHSLIFSPDGKFLAAGSDDNTVSIWDTTSYQLLTTFSNNDSPNKLAFAPDDKTLAISGPDHIIKLWQLDWSVIERAR